jgi:hypothetical protein
MIKFEKFTSVASMNTWLQENQHVKVISLETGSESYDTGLPMPRGGSFYTKRDVFKLWVDDPTLNPTS